MRPEMRPADYPGKGHLGHHAYRHLMAIQATWLPNLLSYDTSGNEVTEMSPDAARNATGRLPGEGPPGPPCLPPSDGDPGDLVAKFAELRHFRQRGNGNVARWGEKCDRPTTRGRATWATMLTAI